jgi:hypothetical protein
MPRVSLAFFTFAALCGLTGMGWGIYMGMAEDHSTFSAHAHLNLLGWVTGSLMGAFYALAKERAPRKLAWTNFGLSVVGPMLMIPSLAAKIKGVEGAPVAVGIAVGAFAAFFGMACFLASVVMVARSRHAETMKSPAAAVTA